MPDLKKEVIVTDGNKAYPNILSELGVEQHLCAFHKIMNQRTFTWKQQCRIKRKQGQLETLKTKNTEKINKEKIKGKGQIGRPSKKDKKRNKSLNKKKNPTTKTKNTEKTSKN